jgi:hypothetical protein
MLMLLLCSCSSQQTWTLVDPVELPAVSKFPLVKTESYDAAWKRIDDAYPKDPIEEKPESLLTQKKCHVRSDKSKNSTSIAIVKANNNILVTRINDDWYSYGVGYIHEYCFRRDR